MVTISVPVLFSPDMGREQDTQENTGPVPPAGLLPGSPPGHPGVARPMPVCLKHDAQIAARTCPVGRWTIPGCQEMMRGCLDDCASGMLGVGGFRIRRTP